MGKRTQILKKKNIANFSEWVRSAQSWCSVPHFKTTK